MSVLLTNTLHRVAKYFHHHPPTLRKKQTAKKCLEAESCLGDFFFVSSHIEREENRFAHYCALRDFLFRREIGVNNHCALWEQHYWYLKFWTQ